MKEHPKTGITPPGDPSGFDTSDWGESAANKAKLQRVIAVRAVLRLGDRRICLSVRYSKQSNAVRRHGDREWRRSEPHLVVLPEIPATVRRSFEADVRPSNSN